MGGGCLLAPRMPLALTAAQFLPPPASEAASGGGEGKQNPLRPSSPEAFVPFSSSSSSQGEPQKEKDSPESPFELVLDRAAFDREYAAALLGERAALSQIPEDQICDFSAKPRGVASVAKSPALCRQSSGTAAALEEVSKCVREMHSFTSELLSWDWVERGDGPPLGDESSGDSDDTVIEDDGDTGDSRASPRCQAGGSVAPVDGRHVGGGGEAAAQRGVSVDPMESPAVKVGSAAQSVSVDPMGSPAVKVESAAQSVSVDPMGSPAVRVESAAQRGVSVGLMENPAIRVESAAQSVSVDPMGSPAIELESAAQRGVSVGLMESSAVKVESAAEAQQGSSVGPMQSPAIGVESGAQRGGSVGPMQSPAIGLESAAQQGSSMGPTQSLSMDVESAAAQQGSSVGPIQGLSLDVESAAQQGGSVGPIQGLSMDVESAAQGSSVGPIQGPAIGAKSLPEAQPRARLTPMEAPPDPKALGSLGPKSDAPKSFPSKTTPPDMEQVTLRALREAMETPPPGPPTPGPPTPPGTPRLLPSLAGNAFSHPKTLP